MNKSDLHPYQLACVEHIIKHNYCGVFLDMGLGKTVSTLTAINSLINEYYSVHRVLVIAPKRVAETVWEEETQIWEHLKSLTCSKIIGDRKHRLEALTKDVDIYIVSRDNIKWLIDTLNGSFPWDMVVVDELSSFKSHKSERFRALKKVRPFFNRFVGLTGTPAPNGLIDLWPQIYLMDMGARLGKTRTMFLNTYFTPGMTVGYAVYNYNLKKGADKAIHSMISDICISMKASDYLRMPPRTDNFIPLIMDDKLKNQYKEFEKESVLELINENGDDVEISALNAAGLCNKLLQFANGAVYSDDDNGNRVTNIIHSLKIQALKEILDTANGQSVLVAFTFQSDKDRIMSELADYNPRLLVDSQDIYDWNAGKVPLMLAHPASAGHGLNLQRGGNIIVWYGLTWSLELYQQFNGRLYRQGQKNPVVINHLVVKGTYDERVVRTLRCKDVSQNALMEDIKAMVNRYKDNLK